MTLQQATDFIKRLSHKGDVNVTTDDITAIIFDCINMARKEIQKDVPNRYLTTTATATCTIGTTTLSLQTALLKPTYFRYTRNQVYTLLKRVADIRDFYTRFLTRSNVPNGPPTHYVDRDCTELTGHVIEMYPPPDEAYVVTYGYLKPFTVEMLGTGQLTAQIADLPTQYHDAVAIGGLFYFLSSFDDPRTDKWEARYVRSRAKNEFFEGTDFDGPLSFRLAANGIQNS